MITREEALTALKADGNTDWQFWREVASALSIEEPEVSSPEQDSSTLSSFLPEMPDDLPELPDGTVYVGKGRNQGDYPPPQSEYIYGYIEYIRRWTSGTRGSSRKKHYAVRLDAPDDIWARFGLSMERRIKVMEENA